MFSQTGIDPFFYICSDRSFCDQQPELFAEALRGSQRVALWEDQIESLSHLIRGEAYPLKKIKQAPITEHLRNHGLTLKTVSLLLSKRARSIGFSEDMGKGFYDARTVAYAALQLAYHVGFRKIFMVGLDLFNAAERFYETGTQNISPCGLDDYFASRIAPSFNLINVLKTKTDLEVYNLSTRSKLPHEIIPKLHIDQVRDLIS